MSGRSQGRFFFSAGEEGSWAGQSRTQMLLFTTVPSAPGQAGTAQLLKKTDPQGADLALPGPKLEVGVWDFLQHSKTLYKPLLGCKAALQGMVLLSGLPAHRKVSGLGGAGYAPHLPQGWERLSCTALSVHVSHLFLAHQSVLLQSHADGGRDATLRSAAHGGSAPLQEPPASRGEPRHLGGLLPGFTGTAQRH